MQFTAAFVAAVMAVYASAAPAPQQHLDDPRHATCLEPFGPTTILKSDVLSAINHIKTDKPTINHGAGCTRDWRTEFEYITVGTVKVIVYHNGSPHCQPPRKVAQGVERVLEACGRSGKYTWEGSYKFGEEDAEIRIVPSKRFGEQ